MNSVLFKSFLLIIVSFLSQNLTAQTSSKANFIDYQKSFPRISDVMKRKEESLKQQFVAKNIPWPAKQVYFRSFKYDSELEVWVRANTRDSFTLFKSYRVCALSGSMGPKRVQGDYQVPEGFYYINEFNPRSAYHLSLGLNYPNLSDKILSDTYRPGGDIYIHGSCVTTGCIPVTDPQMEELYILAAHAKSEGQDFIPVHIFPVRFTNETSVEYLDQFTKSFEDYNPFVKTLQNVFLYFEKYKKLPVIGVGSKGEYITNVNPDDVKLQPKPKPIERKAYLAKQRKKESFDEKTIPVTVNKSPQFPGGNQQYQAFLNQLNEDYKHLLEPSQTTTYILLEFIITASGKLINPTIIRGGNPELNDYILDSFENLTNWEPAVRQEIKVPMKLKQTVVIGIQ